MVERLDLEIVRLTRDADPVEARRLQDRIRGLSDETTDEAGSRREMRRLYASQLALLERLAAECEAQAQRRDRYVESLRTLWLQVSTLRAQHAADNLPADITERIMAICADVQREVSAVSEAHSLATAGRTTN